MFSPTGLYGELQLDRARAYRLLIHAELEAYIEDRGSTLATSAVTEWNANKVLSPTLLGLLAFTKDTENPQPAQPTATVSGMARRLTTALAHYKSRVHQNHGIKTKNICELLLPIGIQDVDLDPVWMNAMDNFGTDRGMVAHQSSAIALVRYAIDPQSELMTVTTLLGGLKIVDEQISAL